MPEEAVLETPVVETPPVAESTPQSQPDEFQGFDEGQKKRISEIVSKRLKSDQWQKLGKPEEVEARLTRAQQLEKFVSELGSRFKGANGEVVKPELTPEQKKVMEFMESISPGFGNWQNERQALQAQLGQIMQAQWQQVTDRNVSQLKNWAEKDGFKPEHVEWIDKMVADSIRGNPEDLKSYQAGWGKTEIVKKHYDEFVKNLRAYAPATIPASVAPNSARAKDALKIAGLPPRMPPGGVTAPTATKRSLNDKERIDSAFADWSKSPANA